MAKKHTRRATIPYGERWCRGDNLKYPGKRCAEYALFVDTELCRWHDEMRPCEVDDCTKLVYAKNKCQAHYMQARRRLINVPPLTPEERRQLREILRERAAQ